jgi:hypothetical protein
MISGLSIRNRCISKYLQGMKLSLFHFLTSYHFDPPFTDHIVLLNSSLEPVPTTLLPSTCGALAQRSLNFLPPSVCCLLTSHMAMKMKSPKTPKVLHHSSSHTTLTRTHDGFEIAFSTARAARLGWRGAFSKCAGLLRPTSGR